MQDRTPSIVGHYAQPALFEQVIAKLEAAGIPASDIKSEHLKPVDEFHIGGLGATQALLDPLGLDHSSHVLDIGSGIGGSARFMAEQYGAQVKGIDLTPEYVACATALGAALKLDVSFDVASALDLPFAAESFDAATLIHVGMNLSDKETLFSEAARVLRDGGVFAIYDIMLFGNPPHFPVPWASTAKDSFLEAPEAYLAAAQKAGFVLSTRRDRGDMAKTFFKNMQAKLAETGPPPVGLPLLMGPTAPEKLSNMVQAVQSGDIQPVEMVFTKG